VEPRSFLRIFSHRIANRWMCLIQAELCGSWTGFRLRFVNGIQTELCGSWNRGPCVETIAEIYWRVSAVSLIQCDKKSRPNSSILYSEITGV